MSKYKVGDKVVMEITDKVEVMEEPNYILSDATVVNQGYIDKAAEPLSTYIEQARAEGQNEAWELARKITCQPINGGFNRSEFEEIFDEGYISDIFEKYPYTEAAAKVAEWEKAKEEIKVGDIVKTKCNTSFEFCVTYIDCNGYLYGVGRNGETYSDKNPEDWEKTDRHTDIDGFLKQIGGEK